MHDSAWECTLLTVYGPLWMWHRCQHPPRSLGVRCGDNHARSVGEVVAETGVSIIEDRRKFTVRAVRVVADTLDSV
jgi:hypothetical protein